VGIISCFLDVDGVLNDHSALQRQWDEHVGFVLADELGRRPEDWSRANRAVFPAFWEARATWGDDSHVLIHGEAVYLIGGMCDYLGVAAPPDAERPALMKRVDIHVASQGSAVVPEAGTILRELSRDFAVHMATGNPSWRVNALLDYLGVGDTVGVRCGSDLVRAAKHSSAFYNQLFALAGVRPEESVIVDDSLAQVRLAAGAGARTVHVTKPCTGPCPADAHVGWLGELPGVLRALRA
jgi:phosphoglycolate phosphatase-like HAD superfamily hydrolase